MCLMFVMINSCDKQSNVFERSVRSTPNVFPFSADNFHVPNIASRQTIGAETSSKPILVF